MSSADDQVIPGQGLVCVHRGTDPIEASLLEGLLQSEGIPATVTGAGLVGGYSGVPKVCDVRLLVAARDRIAARDVLERYRQERPAEGEWACAACGEVNASTFESCWACGQARDP